jgi:hypothetical protein
MALMKAFTLHGTDGRMCSAWYRWKHAHCMVLMVAYTSGHCKMLSHDIHVTTNEIVPKK